MLCAKLLRIKKLLKSSAQSVKWLCAQLFVFMKLNPVIQINWGKSKFRLQNNTVIHEPKVSSKILIFTQFNLTKITLELSLLIHVIVGVAGGQGLRHCNHSRNLTR